MMLVTPLVSGAMIPYDVPVTQPGSAVHQKTSSGWRSRTRRPVRWWVTTAPWTCTAPFGVPVVPLVKCSSAGVSGSVYPMSNEAEASQRNAPIDITRGPSAPVCEPAV